MVIASACVMGLVCNNTNTANQVEVTSWNPTAGGGYVFGQIYVIVY